MSYNIVNTGSGSDLLPKDTTILWHSPDVSWQYKAIIWTNINLSCMRPIGIYLAAGNFTKVFQMSLTTKSLKMTCLKILPHLPSINKLILNIFLAATKQLYKWYFPSVRLSVCPSVRLSVRLSVTPFWLCSHHRIIMKFSGVITNDQRKVHAKGQGQRSKVKVTEVTTQLNRFRTVTPVWIHIWWWNDAYSLMLLRRGALLFFKVIRQISRSHGSKNRRIWPRLGVSGL